MRYVYSVFMEHSDPRICRLYVSNQTLMKLSHEANFDVLEKSVNGQYDWRCSELVDNEDSFRSSFRPVLPETSTTDNQRTIHSRW